MFEGFMFYIIAGFMVLVITILGIIKASKTYKVAIVISFLLFLPLTYWTIIDLLSRPRPVNLMMKFQRPDPEKAKVMAVYMVENKYILLLLYWDGLDYPRYFRWNWDQQMAEQITDAQNKANHAGSRGEKMMLEMVKPFDSSLERRHVKWVHPIPQYSKSPPKRPTKQNIIKFKRDTHA